MQICQFGMVRLGRLDDRAVDQIDLAWRP